MDNGKLTGLLHGLPGVDQVGLEGRAATLATRSIKKDSKIWAIDTAISMVDLTTLEGMDTDGKVRALCAKALHPDPTDPTCPAVAAVCVYGDLVATTRACVADRVHVAAVATAFPSGRASMDVKLMDTKQAVADGADEIDMVIDRGAFLAGNYAKVFEEIVGVKEACGEAHLKVILETGELKTYDNVRRASWLAMQAGADFIKTSTGKVSPAATLPVTLLMLEAVRDFADQTGTRIGVIRDNHIRSHSLGRRQREVHRAWLLRVRESDRGEVGVRVELSIDPHAGSEASIGQQLLEESTTNTMHRSDDTDHVGTPILLVGAEDL